ncbi:cyclopropane-fatty-acyl-phospholipid synthase [Pandoraea sp. NE5]|uniref:SAM-dependent methyltransferase n=1 Tax=Pandoraea sp. NE5 TaxID=2904129 RepID=UPI0021C28DA0|nr:cyclopropane-fatty-acyl-phospholipid synthase family protein [Pandoraea sp. NE5]BDD93709.1 cyclopropane-fatty-acyl-phospholipid synthase [Pandoraea sp. NE5]
MLDKVLDVTVGRWSERIREELNLPIQLSLPSGKAYNLGDSPTPKVALRVNHSEALSALLEPSLDTLGEAYIRAHIDIDGDLSDVVRVAYQLTSSSVKKPSAVARLARRFSHTRKDDKDAVQYHYDVSNDFYRLWLDERMVYSCAYFEDGNETLEAAQLKKIDHILNKIRIAPGNTLLDIGCGWGALVIRAAQRFGVKCVGVTLSERQLALGRQRVEQAGLTDLIELRLQDYRDVKGVFDRITSVGMFEHVGLANLPSYFRTVGNLLAEDGIALNHGITSTDAQSGDTPFGGGTFIDRYVFPAGELPHLSLAIQAMQEGGLEVLDVENLRRHYAQTLREWTTRYERNGEAIRRLVGEEKYRIWRVYLAGCAYAFEVDNVAIFQVLCQRSRQSADAIPRARRYMYSPYSLARQPSDTTERNATAEVQ